MRFIVLGPANAGKSVLLHKLKFGQVICPIPTVGVNEECLTYKDTHLTFWEVARPTGNDFQSRKEYLSLADGIIFVLDSSDDEEALTAGLNMLASTLAEIPQTLLVLVYANKQDKPNAVSPSSIAEHLRGLILRQKWFIQGISAPQGGGLYEGLDWLTTTVAQGA
jgi:ADP-ribosylation factor protein 1